MCRTAEGNANRGGVVWHDDGSVKDDDAKEHKMYQRDTADNVLTLQQPAEALEPSLAEPAQPQIPVPAAAAIPEAEQQSLAAAQQAVDLGPSPVTDFAGDAVGASHRDAQAVPGASNSAAGASNQAPPAASDGTALPAEHSDAVLSTAAASDTSLHGDQAASLNGVEVPLAKQQAAGTSSKELQQLPDANDASAAPASPEKASNVDTVLATELRSKTTDVSADVTEAAGSGPMDTEVGNVQQNNVTAPVSTEDAAAASVTAASGGDDGSEAIAGEVTAGTTEPATSDASATQTAAAAKGSANGSTNWKGTGKGPGLGQSQEFSGGPVNFARPKYRHAPYNLPPARGGGRFGAGNTWSPRGRASPRGISSPAGRGFSDPLRSFAIFLWGYCCGCKCNSYVGCSCSQCDAAKYWCHAHQYADFVIIHCHCSMQQMQSQSTVLVTSP